jgi:hypothetical protein
MAGTEFSKFLTPDLVEAQGKNDREFLTHRFKLLLEAKEKFPGASMADLTKAVDPQLIPGTMACGCGCCCCCGSLFLPGSEAVLPGKQP